MRCSASVLGTLLTGLEAFALEDRRYKHRDASLVRRVRRASRGADVKWLGGEPKKLPGRAVLRMWGYGDTRCELTSRRTRAYQRLFK